MNRMCLVLMVAGLLIPGCGTLLEIEPNCRITAVSSEARRNAEGHELHEYDYRFVADSDCGDTEVHGSYNVVTHEVEEDLQRADANASGSWLCPTDPWTSPDYVANCAKIDLHMEADVQLTEKDYDDFARTGSPISVYPLELTDRNALRGQLGNALRQLPPPGGAPVIVLEHTEEVVQTGGSADALRDALAELPDTTPATGPVVEKGARGRNVEAIQHLLNQSGEDVVVDGTFGDQTDAAVRAFQKKQKNLAQDGRVGPLTWRALWVTLRKGAPETDGVRALQALLSWHGFDAQVDGDFGNQTDDLVRKFQTASKLGVDGVVGTATWTALVKK